MSNAVAPLFEPLKVGSVTLRNRIVMSAMTRRFSPGRIPGENVAAYYRRRAASGTGLIITEGCGIDDPAAIDDPGIPVMHGDAALSGWRRVVDEVHAVGGVIFPQLWHQGVLRDRRSAPNPEAENRTPSGILGPIGQTSLSPDFIESASAPAMPMTEADIADVIAAFVQSAANAISVGFDGIALHGGHGYLIDSFLWDGTNRRTDQWGGDNVERTRFAVALVRAIRSAIGPDKPILFRFSQHKQQDYASHLADTPERLGEILGPLADAGVDIFDASSRRFWMPAFPDSDLNLAGWAKKLTGKVAMAVGSVGLAATLEESFSAGVAQTVDNIPAVVECLKRGEFDLIGIGRAILADPAWPSNIASGAPSRPFDKSMLQSLD